QDEEADDGPEDEEPGRKKEGPSHERALPCVGEVHSGATHPILPSSRIRRGAARAVGEDSTVPSVRVHRDPGRWSPPQPPAPRRPMTPTNDGITGRSRKLSWRSCAKRVSPGRRSSTESRVSELEASCTRLIF